MPRICSFYNPSFCKIFLILLYIIIFFFTSETNMCHVPSFDRWFFYIWKVTSFIKAQILIIEGLLTTTLSTVFVISFISCVFADVKITESGMPDNGMPFWSTNTWRLAPILPLSMGFGPTYHFLPKALSQRHCQAIANSIQCLWSNHKVPTL